MNSWIIFSIAFIATILILGVFRAIRAHKIARRAGILKVCVSTSLIIPVVFSAAFVFYGINRLSESEKYTLAANRYEMLLRTANGGYGVNGGNGYQQAAVKTETLSSPFDTSRISNDIRVYRENARTLKAYAIFLFALAFSELIAASSAVWYITEYGVVLVNFKYPEPIYAVQNGNRIVIHYTARVQNFGRVKSFKATPKNLEIFSRFMVQGAPQGVQYPINPQYPQYPIDPHFPQAPQYPQNNQYPQYQQIPQVQQPPQAPNDPNNQNNTPSV